MSKKQLIRRDGAICQRCGTIYDLTIDHIHPTSKGGSNDMTNKQLLCVRCNTLKGDKLVERYSIFAKKETIINDKYAIADDMHFYKGVKSKTTSKTHTEFLGTCLLFFPVYYPIRTSRGIIISDDMVLSPINMPKGMFISYRNIRISPYWYIETLSVDITNDQLIGRVSELVNDGFTVGMGNNITSFAEDVNVSKLKIIKGV